MKVYQVRKGDKDLGTLLEWHPSRQSAEKALREHQREREGTADRPESVEVVDIPTDRRGLLNWLNSHFTSDNG